MIVKNYNCEGKLIEDLSKVKISEDIKMIWQSAYRQDAEKKNLKKSQGGRT